MLVTMALRSSLLKFQGSWGKAKTVFRYPDPQNVNDFEFQVYSRFYSNGTSFNGSISFRTATLGSHLADAGALDASETMTVNEGYPVPFSWRRREG